MSKIGFHINPGSSSKVVGSWLQTLHQAGVPFFVQITDDEAALAQAQAFATAEPQVGHTIIFRRDRLGRQGGFAEPDYDLAPEAAAAAHWQKHRAALPADFDKDHVWLALVDRPRGERPFADWLGHFSVHLAQLALAEGYKTLAGGFGAGAPDPATWGSDGWLRYFELCQQHPDQLGVALQEFSLKTRDIWFMRGDHIGRFTKLLQTCDDHQIKRPFLYITQLGWTHNRLPSSSEQALADVEAVADYYDQYPEIVGAALWMLGRGSGGIGRQLGKLIEPLTAWATRPRPAADVFEAEEAVAVPGERRAAPEAAPTRFPMEEPERRALRVLRPLNGRFISDVTIDDDTPIPFGQTFTKTWRVENNGTQPWGNGFTLRFVGGTGGTAQSIPLPPTQPGQQVELSVNLTAPTRGGTFYWDFRFANASGTFFGDIIYARIVAVKPATGGTPDAKFIRDVTIPDDTPIEPGTTFTKTWRVLNNGSVAWGPGFSLRFVGGTAMTNGTRVELTAVIPPNSETDLSVTLQAPPTPGSYYGDWRLHDPSGNPFGHLVFLRITVPTPTMPSLAPAMSQRDPLWADSRLGHAGSTKTIGEWGCLLTCFAMTATALGRTTDPRRLNDAMVSSGGFLDLYLTKWKALTDVYSDIIYDGRMVSQPDIIQYIDNSLSAGNPVSIQVDFTSATPYTDNDQHWVLIVAKDGDDYRINDPWLLPGQQASLRQRYGKADLPFWQTIISAIFYHSIRRATPAAGPGAEAPARLQTGMNVNPDAPNSNPMSNDDLKGLDWVRFVGKIDARPNPADRTIATAFAQYDPIIRAYQQQGTKSLIILNQETIWGIAPWTGNGNWAGYADQLADAARQIARRYSQYGAGVAYQIWNEGDKRNNPASVFVEPENYARILQKVVPAIRTESPQSPIIFNGMATGPEETVAYLRRTQAALGGSLLVDAVGIHPYTRWATKAPFDWGSKYGTLADAFAIYKQAFPNLLLWITEIGVADDNEIGPQWYREIGDYMADVYRHVQERHRAQVPVVIWFGWSDWMRNAGVVRRDGSRKDHVYPAFRLVRNREL